jgi:exosortase
MPQRVTENPLLHCRANGLAATVRAMALPRASLPLLAIVTFAALWALLFLQVHNVWSSTPQYNYGWAVPLLAAYLFWNRWENRPAPGPALPTQFLVAVVVALAFTLLPVCVIQESNRDWRAMNWAFAFSVTGISFAALAWMGGRAWIRHFAFPVLFAFIAVPWPTIIEDPLVLTLMRVVSFCAVEGLNLCSIPAIQRGNVIEIGAGMVGVSEACSGIQSFQSALMVSLFLGELFQFTARRRIGLFAAAVAWAFACNLVCAFFLAWISHREGLAALDRWHDGTGLALMVGCYGGIIALALALSRRAENSPPKNPPTESPLAASASEKKSRTFPAAALVALLAWLAIIELTTEFWYRRNERSTAPQPTWGITWPRQLPQFRTEEFSDLVRRMLLYNEAESASWRNDDGTYWLGFFFRWHPGNSRAKTTQVHKPEVCFPSSGMSKTADHGRRNYAVAGLTIPFETYTFRDDRQFAHVFYCLWQNKLLSTATPEKHSTATSVDANGAPVPTGDWKTRTRLRNAWNGERQFGQQVLEIIVYGPDDFALIEKAFAQRLPELIKPR